MADEWDDEEAPDPEAEEVTEEPEDDLEDLDEDLKARAMAFAARQAQGMAATQAQELAQTEIDRFRGEYGRRFGRTIKDAQAKGLTVGEDGALGVSDPVALISGFGLSGKPAESEVVEEEEINSWDTSEAITRKVNSRVARQTEAAVKPVLAELQEFKGMMTAFMGQQAQPQTTAAARGFLDTLGLGHVADAPDFEQRMQYALKDTPLSDRGSAEVIRTATGMVLGSYNDDVLKPKAAAQNGNGRSAQQASLNRAALGSIAPSRGGGTPEYTDFDVEGAKAIGVSIAEWRSLPNDTSVDETLARRRKAGR